MDSLKLVFFFLFCFFATHAMEEGDAPLKTIDDVPTYYAAMALKLAKQDFFTGKNSIGLSNSNVKILPVNSWRDCRITEIFSKNMKSKLKIAGPGGIHAVDSSFGFYDTNGKNVGTALMALHESDELGNSNTLKIYEEIVGELKQGWNKEEESSECYCFLKDSKLQEEDCLIRFLVSRFSLEKAMECDHTKYYTALRIECPDKMYLLIRKDSIKEIQEKLKFELSY